MSRYIDADALKESLEESYRAAVNCSELAKTEEIRAKSSWIEVTLLEAILRVDDAPTANVRENVKGEWSDSVARSVYGEERQVRSCSVCGCSYFRYDNSENTVDETPKYCPNCGADMRGNGNE